jgi:hypothetical protein
LNDCISRTGTAFDDRSRFDIRLLLDVGVSRMKTMPGKKKTYGTVFPEAVEAKLLETAAEKGISVSDLIRDAVAKYFGMLREAKQDKPIHGGWRPLPKPEESAGLE